MVAVRRLPHLRSVHLMLAAVLGYSLLPLLVDLSGNWGSVALVTGAWAGIHSLVNAAAARRWHQQSSIQIGPVALWRMIPWWAHAAAFAAAFQWALFAWASRLAETAVTTIIFEFWPVVFIVGGRVLPTPIGKLPVRTRDVLFVGAASVGLVLVILSERSASSTAMTGIILATVALAISMVELLAFLRSSERVAASLMTTGGSAEVTVAIARVRSLVGSSQNVTARGAAAVLLIALGLVESHGSGVGPMLSAAAAGLVLGAVHAVSGLAFTFSNNLSDTDTINSFAVAVPALALLWLWMLTDVTVESPALFVFGAISVFGVNAVLHLRSLQHSRKMTVAADQADQVLLPEP